MVQEMQNFETVVHLSVVHDMGILGVVSRDCSFGWVRLKKSFYGFEGLYWLSYGCFVLLPGYLRIRRLSRGAWLA